MNVFTQGDIIKIQSIKNQLFVIVSKNAFIKATAFFHVCPMLSSYPAGPLHIYCTGKNGTTGTVICEQVKLIDPNSRNCVKIDLLSYNDIVNVSDAVQGMFEYD